ncbi:hypothetical protein [Komagataeibacter xylinus]|uniref:hypothetical protein n=1 Tax=Komagataeibacter xylinus TaxID=28448 RepID=UPI00280C2368|nr:hypothetical protein [Komagataeibacter xylinus]
MHSLLRADTLDTCVLTRSQYSIIMDLKEIDGLRGIWERMGRVRANPAANLPDLWLEVETMEYMAEGLLLYCPMATDPDGTTTFDLDNVLMILGRYEDVTTIPGWLAPERTLYRIDASRLLPDEVELDPVEYD